MGRMSATDEQWEALLKILRAGNIARIFESQRDFLVGRIAEFSRTYQECLREHLQKGLPATATLGDLLAEHQRNPHRVNTLLQAVAFSITPNMLAMMWMVLMGAEIAAIRYQYERREKSILAVSITLPDRQALRFESSDHWDAAVLKLMGLSKSDDQPVVEDFHALHIPRAKKDLAPLLPDDVQKKIYDDTVNDPMAWLLTADNNLIAADKIDDAKEAALKAPRAIEHIMRTTWVSLMLRAFAIECLLKAIHVKAGNALGTGGKMTSGFPGKHDLVAMWEALNLPPLTPARRSVLTKLTAISTSIGRFPVAINSTRDNPSPGTLVRMQWHTGESQVVAELVNDLKSRLPASIQPYPTPPNP
jgi:hypothetical protein